MSQSASESSATENAYASEGPLQGHEIYQAVAVCFVGTAIFLLVVFLITGVLRCGNAFLARLDAAEMEARRRRRNQLANRDQPRHVVMVLQLEPGELYPTQVARPPPLLPCSREGVRRPPREI